VALEVSDSTCEDALKDSILRVPPTAYEICPLLERELASASDFRIQVLATSKTVFIRFNLRMEQPWRFEQQLQAVLQRLNAGTISRYWPDRYDTRNTCWDITVTIHDFGTWKR
jgi:hypothetical protein